MIIALCTFAILVSILLLVWATHILIFNRIGPEVKRVAELMRTDPEGWDCPVLSIWYYHGEKVSEIRDNYQAIVGTRKVNNREDRFLRRALTYMLLARGHNKKCQKILEE